MLRKSHFWHLLVMGAAVAVLTACNGMVKQSDDSGNGPDWILDAPLEQGFLYGVGSAEIFGGDTAGAVSRAKDMARVELVKQIEIDVSGAVDQEISESIQGSTTQLTMKLRQEVRSRVPQFKLSHAVTLESHQENHRVSVLVRLDVTKEMRALRRQIISLDEQLEQYEQKLKESSSTGMSTLGLISPALILVEQRAGLQSRFNQLNPAREGGALLTDDIRAFMSKMYSRIAHIKVSVSPKDVVNHSLKTALVAQLTQKGMRISSTGSGDIQIVYSLYINSVERDGVIYAITEGDIWINDENGRVVRAVQAKAKGASGDPVEARSRSVKKLSDILGKELLKALF